MSDNKYEIPDRKKLAEEIARAGIVTASITPAPADGAKRIKIRPTTLKSGEACQIERFVGAQAFQKNVARENLAAELGDIFSRGAVSAEFNLSEGATRVITLRSNRRGEVSVIRHPRTTASENDATQGVLAACATRTDPAHDRKKTYLLPEGTPVQFLVDLGVMTETGAVIKSKYDKFRQINRFLEFVDDIVPFISGKGDGDEATKSITFADFGCGKAYLTFACYHFLSVVRGFSVRAFGIDRKADVMAECDRLARKYGYAGLSFEEGDIADWAGTDSIDLGIALHACDTATDYALAQAVRRDARVILVAPCCQHELNAQIAEREPRAEGKATLESALRHGIVRERVAALFTDALRAELLEGAGYRTQLLEFIDAGHTPKNILIRAVKAGRGSSGTDPSRDRREAYERLKKFLGVEPTLERLLAARAGGE